jgi:hypothetical protein
MHWAMTSKSLKGKAILCVACKVATHFYVAVLKINSGRSTEKHWYVCMSCYVNDKWQEPTSKTKPNKKRIKKPAVKLQAGAWEDSIKANAKPSTDW